MDVVVKFSPEVAVMIGDEEGEPGAVEVLLAAELEEIAVGIEVPFDEVKVLNDPVEIAEVDEALNEIPKEPEFVKVVQV